MDERHQLSTKILSDTHSIHLSKVKFIQAFLMYIYTPSKKKMFHGLNPFSKVRTPIRQLGFTSSYKIKLSRMPTGFCSGLNCVPLPPKLTGLSPNPQNLRM